MPRSLKKGPFVDDHLKKKVDQMNARRREARDQDVVTPVDGDAGHGRSHDRRARRTQARPGVHHRVAGRTQARRVRGDADLPQARRVRESVEGQVAMSRTMAKTKQAPAREGRAMAKWLRISPIKARRAADLIRRQGADGGAASARVHAAQGRRARVQGARVGRRERDAQLRPARGPAVRPHARSSTKASRSSAGTRAPTDARTDPQADGARHGRRARTTRPPAEDVS